VRQPQSNRICERFHRTIQKEFYAVSFRKKLYDSLTALQKDLDEWMVYYNNERAAIGGFRYIPKTRNTYYPSGQNDHDLEIKKGSFELNNPINPLNLELPKNIGNDYDLLA
jgi:Integrase core domain